MQKDINIQELLLQTAAALQYIEKNGVHSVIDSNSTDWEHQILKFCKEVLSMSGINLFSSGVLLSLHNRVQLAAMVYDTMCYGISDVDKMIEYELLPNSSFSVLPLRATVNFSTVSADSNTIAFKTVIPYIQAAERHITATAAAELGKLLKNYEPRCAPAPDTIGTDITLRLDEAILVAITIAKRVRYESIDEVLKTLSVAVTPTYAVGWSELSTNTQDEIVDVFHCMTVNIPPAFNAATSDNYLAEYLCIVAILKANAVTDYGLGQVDEQLGQELVELYPDESENRSVIQYALAALIRRRVEFVRIQLQKLK